MTTQSVFQYPVTIVFQDSILVSESGVETFTSSFLSVLVRPEQLFEF